MTRARIKDASLGFFWKYADRLSIRFALVLAISLLPLGIVSLMQTKVLQNEIQRRTEAALLGNTLRSASGEIGLIRSAQGMVAGLATSLRDPLSPEACADLMRRSALQLPQASLVAFFPKDGLMTCSSNGRSHSYADSALFQGVIAAQAPTFVVNRNATISATSILGVSHPVFDAFGIYQGYVSVSLPHNGLAKVDQEKNQAADRRNDGILFWTFDRDGVVLTASAGLENVFQQLPNTRVLASFIGQNEDVFQDLSNAGTRRTYAVVPLVPGQLYLMGSWDEAGAQVISDALVWPYLPPITMWIVGLIVSAVASERLVTRHVRTISRSILRFANGDRGLRPSNVRGAPIELRQVSDAFQNMTYKITRGEAELEDSVHQKEVLLREVHHRVKNNLQLIASIMNMQMRKAIAPEAKALLKGLQDRVMSLATIHRGLYQTSGLADVRADELFRDIVRQIVNMGSSPARKFEVNLDLVELHLPPDQAVPLSLLLTEAMTNAMKYAGTAPGKPVEIAVRLKTEQGGMQLLQVVNSLPGKSDAIAQEHESAAKANSTGLGEQLLSAFSQQLGGTLSHDITDEIYSLSIRFKAKSLTPDHTTEAAI